MSFSGVIVTKVDRTKCNLMTYTVNREKSSVFSLSECYFFYFVFFSVRFFDIFPRKKKKNLA